VTKKKTTSEPRPSKAPAVDADSGATGRMIDLAGDVHAARHKGVENLSTSELIQGFDSWLELTRLRWERTRGGPDADEFEKKTRWALEQMWRGVIAWDLESREWERTWLVREVRTYGEALKTMRVNPPPRLELGGGKAREVAVEWSPEWEEEQLDLLSERVLSAASVDLPRVRVKLRELASREGTRGLLREAIRASSERDPRAGDSVQGRPSAGECMMALLAAVGLGVGSEASLNPSARKVAPWHKRPGAKRRVAKAKS
jgi:hypothetical protein